MTTTRPRSEQIRFESAATGSHELDTYLEDAERGGRELSDLLADLFDTDGALTPGYLELRITAGGVVQYRTAGTGAWTDLQDLFVHHGAWTTATAYARTDTVTYNGQVYICITAHTAGATFVGDAAYWVVALSLAGNPVYYRGTFDASDAYPASPGQGDLYAASVAGTLSAVAYDIGDFALYDGSAWSRIENTATDRVAKSGDTMTGPLEMSGASVTSKIYLGSDADTLDGWVQLNRTDDASLAGSRSLNFMSNVGTIAFYNSRLSPTRMMQMTPSLVTVDLPLTVGGLLTTVGNIDLGGTQISQATASGLTLSASHASGVVYLRAAGGNRLAASSTGVAITGVATATQGMPMNSISSGTATVSSGWNGNFFGLEAACTLTIPANSTDPIPVGAEFVFWQIGAGTVTFTPAGGVTLRSKGGLTSIGGQYAAVTLKKIATDTWVLIGDLV